MTTRAPLYKARIVAGSVKVREDLIRSRTTPPAATIELNGKIARIYPIGLENIMMHIPITKPCKLFLYGPHNAGDGEIELRISCLLRDGACPSSVPKTNRRSNRISA
jgi:hypothetical protein